jgi:GNAT superfamily N-acetyltransferase
VISIRDSTRADRPAVEAVRRASWREAYAGLIGQSYIERATSGPSGISHPAPWRRTLIAVSDSGTPEPMVVGYTAFGPERSVLGPQRGTTGRAAADRPPLTAAGLAGEAGEVYAIYVAPSWWSTGTGRSLMEAAVAGLVSTGYRRAVLWVLDTNSRARRFYEKAGWAPDGAANTMEALGGVVEVRYIRPLSLRQALPRARRRRPRRCQAQPMIAPPPAGASRRAGQRGMRDGVRRRTRPLIATEPDSAPFSRR